MSKRHSDEYKKEGHTKSRWDLKKDGNYDEKRMKISDDSSEKSLDDYHEKDKSTSDKFKEESKSEETKLDLSKKSKFSSGIRINLGAAVAKVKNENKPKLSVAAVFNQESDEEPEEMPPEAKMRMRNIGRDTPTSSGPNSFGKTKQGFCHAKRVFEKSMEKALEGVDN